MVQLYENKHLTGVYVCSINLTQEQFKSLTHLEARMLPLL